MTHAMHEMRLIVLDKGDSKRDKKEIEEDGTVGRKCLKMTHRGKENHSHSHRSLHSAVHRSAPFHGALRRYTPLRGRRSTTLRSARGARSRVRKWRRTNEGSMCRFWTLSAHIALHFAPLCCAPLYSAPLHSASLSDSASRVGKWRRIYEPESRASILDGFEP